MSAAAQAQLIGDTITEIERLTAENAEYLRNGSKMLGEIERLEEHTNALAEIERLEKEIQDRLDAEEW
jgi:hypothetical protein